MRILLVAPNGEGHPYTLPSTEITESIKRMIESDGFSVIKDFEGYPEYLDEYGDIYKVLDSGEVTVMVDRMKEYAKFYCKRYISEKQTKLLEGFDFSFLTAQNLLPPSSRALDIQQVMQIIEEQTSKLEETLAEIEASNTPESIDQAYKEFLTAL